MLLSANDVLDNYYANLSCGVGKETAYFLTAKRIDFCISMAEREEVYSPYVNAVKNLASFWKEWGNVHLCKK